MIPARQFSLGKRGFTLIEMLIVLVLIGIAVGLAVPEMGTTQALRLREAARMLAGDIEYAANEAIAHPDDPRLIKLGASGNQYWIAPASTPDTAITDTLRGGTYTVNFGSGKAESLLGVTIQSYSLGGDAVLKFDRYGVPDQTTTATITLTCGSDTLTVQVAPTGEVGIP